MAKSLLHPRDELQLLTVVLDDNSIMYGNDLLVPYAPDPCFNTVKPVVLIKGDDRMGHVIKQYVATSGADLLIVGSHNLCSTGTREDPLPAAGSFALRLVKAIRCCPVLVVKANTKGPYLRSDNAAMGLKVMVDCLGNSRHMLQWLMDQLDCHKDGIFLSVSKALDQGTGHVKTTATRMLTNFTVQATVNEYYTAQRIYKDAAHKELPQVKKNSPAAGSN
eukprot:gene8512-8694_t